MFSINLEYKEISNQAFKTETHNTTKQESYISVNPFLDRGNNQKSAMFTSSILLGDSFPSNPEEQTIKPKRKKEEKV
ncbi:hypothetical protein NXV02_25145 [Bacteroides ovatus]|nr:hypothetical protein [Bacteroides ovatus]